MNGQNPKNPNMNDQKQCQPNQPQKHGHGQQKPFQNENRRDESNSSKGNEQRPVNYKKKDVKSEEERGKDSWKKENN